MGADPESLLESYYSQLLKWGAVLTRGDGGMAHDIVHDLCLHFTLAKPDLSQVTNLDGYLYTCLRNIYLSALARSSREATQIISVAEFDSIHFALNTTTSSDAILQRQNDLRRICGYTMWRKGSSKSASYLILLFFHGYCRREVAEIACLPIAAIYNKLKIARAEVKSYLEDSGKLRIATRDVPPEAALRLSPVSSVELFGEFRETILLANPRDCMPADALIDHYAQANPTPIPCSLLSHVVSCERCLNLIDRHFQRPTLEDREPPEDFGLSIDRKGTDAGGGEKSFGSMMRSIRRQRERIYEHRPRTLSIAVNGKITAFHDVHGERSALSSRVEYSESAQFVEVFTEQRIRLAFLPVGDRPPEGSHTHVQRVVLSDDRWLDLTLNFDGQGLQSEVTYFDPALAVVMAEEEANDEVQGGALAQQIAGARTVGFAKKPSILAVLLQSLRGIALRPAMGWAVLLACFGITGFFAYRHYRPTLNANDLLNQSVRIESAELQGQAEHQILHFEEADADGNVLGKATVDVWKERDTGRYMRRLYNEQHQLIAAEWRAMDGKSGSYISEKAAGVSEPDRVLAASMSWDQDLSASSFRSLARGKLQIRAVGENYELTSESSADSSAHLVYATLVLDHNLRSIREVLQMRTGSTTRELRFVQANYERKPASSVPESIFDPTELAAHAGAGDAARSPWREPRLGQTATDVLVVETQIRALHQLSKLGADIGEPIEVTRTTDGRIRVAGTVANDGRRQQIGSALSSLPDQQFLELRLAAPRDLHMPAPGMGSKLHSATSVYSFAQTDAPATTVLRKYFGAKGWTGERIDAAVAQFSQDALGHTQRALQHAYALNRLGSAFTSVELNAVSPDSKRQWAEMAAQHASALESELRGLDEQLKPIAPPDGNPSQSETSHIQIDNPGQFARAAGHLLRQTQNLNSCVGNSFASGPAGKTTERPEALLLDALHSIPLRNATDVADFSARLASSEKTANSLDQPPSHK